jgi:cell division protein FtsB
VNYAKQIILKRLTSLKSQVKLYEDKIVKNVDEIAELNRSINFTESNIEDLEEALNKIDKI